MKGSLSKGNERRMPNKLLVENRKSLSNLCLLLNIWIALTVTVKTTVRLLEMYVLPYFLIFSSTLTAGALEPPSQFRGASPLTGAVSIELTWEDQSEGESGFEVELSNDGSTGWIPVSTVSSNQTRVSLNGGGLGQTFFFRVRALAEDGENSDFSEVISVSFPSVVSVAIDAGLFGGGQVGGSVTTSEPTTFFSTNEPRELVFSAEGLPTGLVVDAATGMLSGIPEDVGIFRPLLTVDDGSSEASTFVTLRIVAADSGPELIDDSLLIPLCGSEFSFSVGDLVFDEDTTEAVRIETNDGVIDVILYPEATPITVNNFLSYVDAGAYSDVIFHRAVTAGLSIIQAGIFRPDPLGASDAYTTIDLEAAITNEPGLSNIRGTIAPAKTANPDSATSQWFFNTIDNSVSLDSPNNSGGFSVFGRASTPTLPVLDSIQGRPTGTYPLALNGSATTLTDWPTLMLPSGASPDPLTDLIQIQSVTRITPVKTELNSLASSGVAEARLEGDELIVSGLQAGVEVLELTLADLDGNEEIVLLSVQVLDLAACAEVVGEAVGVFSFRHLKMESGFSYQVETSRDLEIWEEFWNTSDGFSAPVVTSQVDLGESLELGFEVALPTSEEPPLFFRVLVEKMATE